MNAPVENFELEPGALLPRIERPKDYKDPFRFNQPKQFKDVMLETLLHNASDIFIQPNMPICASINGILHSVTDRPLDSGEVQDILTWAGGRDTALTDIVSGRSVNSRYELFDPNLLDHRGAKIRYGYRVNASPIQIGGNFRANRYAKYPNKPTALPRFRH